MESPTIPGAFQEEDRCGTEGHGSVSNGGDRRIAGLDGLSGPSQP